MKTVKKWNAKDKRLAPVIGALVKQHGAAHRRDIADGVVACARVWNWKSGSAAAFRDFCGSHYVPPGAAKSALLTRLDSLWRTITGGMMMIRKEARAGLDIADYPFTPAEEVLGAFTVGAHLDEDLRYFQLAQLVQLNFGTARRDIPSTREGWAARRLGEWGRDVVPSRLKTKVSQVQAVVDRFVSGYNLHLENIRFGDPDIVFPKGTRLVSHWGLRDYMMQLYDDPHGVKKQRAILGLLRRVVDGEVPAAILDQPEAVWDIPAGTVTVGGKSARVRGHGDLRWAHFHKLFAVMRQIDPYTRHGNMIDNKFLEDREMTESRVRHILTSILGSPVAPRVGAYLTKQFGRALEPFDLYFKNFTGGTKKPPLGYDLGTRYGNTAELQAAIPAILQQLGFTPDLAVALAAKIRVDNGRSAGHAWSPGGPHDLQLLRVRVPDGGISEIEFGTFMHELGHCVEGVLSAFHMDYGTLWGVPNTALTEAFAFTFQDRADMILGRSVAEDLRVVTLQRFWEVFEIAGPALVEIDFFHWLYQHPRATPAQMLRAMRGIADGVWQKYHARIFGKDGHGMLAAYSHVLWCDFYLADYPLGYVCAYQIRRFLRDKVLGQEMPRMCKAGAIYPDNWMQLAVGAPINAAPLLGDTEEALKMLALQRAA